MNATGDFCETIVRVLRVVDGKPALTGAVATTRLRIHLTFNKPLIKRLARLDKFTLPRQTYLLVHLEIWTALYVSPAYVWV